MEREIIIGDVNVKVKRLHWGHMFEFSIESDEVLIKSSVSYSDVSYRFVNQIGWPYYRFKYEIRRLVGRLGKRTGYRIRYRN